jgi:hypothetical protein
MRSQVQVLHRPPPNPAFIKRFCALDSLEIDARNLAYSQITANRGD